MVRKILSFGIDWGRLKRVVARIPNWMQWCEEWTKEGDELYRKAEQALNEGYSTKAKALFHAAVGCYHVGQHIFFIDSSQKEGSQEKARRSYKQAIRLYEDKDKPIRIEIPFQGVKIPAYLRLSGTPNQPLVIFVNGMDNIKEAEGHSHGTIYRQHGFNFITFDGPGQGELWKDMKFDVKEYHKAVSAIIDWSEKQQDYQIDTQKIALTGFSLGGYLAPVSAAYDRRVKCVVGNSGLVYTGGASRLKAIESDLAAWRHLYDWMYDT